MKENHHKPTRQYGGVDADQRMHERREKFIAAGLESFGTLGYGQATIRGICQLAGLTERYFYESFNNKEDLLCAVFNRLISELEAGAQMIIETPGTKPEEAACQITKSFYLLFLQDPRRARVQLFEVLGVSPRVDEEYRESIKTLAGWIKIIFCSLFPSLEPEWLETTIIPTSISGAMIANAHQWVLDGFQTPVDDIVSQSMEMFMAIGNHYQNQHQHRSEK
jgi:AcrR family transcriptional regulator